MRIWSARNQSIEQETILRAFILLSGSQEPAFYSSAHRGCVLSPNRGRKHEADQNQFRADWSLFVFGKKLYGQTSAIGAHGARESEQVLAEVGFAENAR